MCLYAFTKFLFVWISCIARLVNFQQTTFWSIFLIYSRKTGFDISCKFSPLEKICMKCQILFSGKNKKIYRYFCRLLNLPRLWLKLNPCFTDKLYALLWYERKGYIKLSIYIYGRKQIQGILKYIAEKHVYLYWITPTGFLKTLMYDLKRACRETTNSIVIFRLCHHTNYRKPKCKIRPFYSINIVIFLIHQP